MEDDTNIGNGSDERKPDGIGIILFGIYLVFLMLTVVIIGRIVYIQLFYKPESVYIEKFTPGSRKVVIKPERGAILSHDGRILAASTPKYQIAMDCTVRRQEFAEMTDREKGERAEAEWLGKARKLAEGLSGIYKDKTAGGYYRLIAESRRTDRRYVKIGGLVDYETYRKVMALPLFNEGQYKGGAIVEKYDKRIYPYGSLARRLLGHLVFNNTSHYDVCIEVKYVYVLLGTDGL